MTRTLRRRHAMVWLVLLPAILLSIIVIRLVQTSHDEPPTALQAAPSANAPKGQP